MRFVGVNAVESDDFIEAFLVLLMHLLLDFIEWQRYGYVSVRSGGGTGNTWIVGVKGTHLGVGRLGEHFADVQNLIVQRCRFVVFMQRIDGGNKDRLVRNILRLDQPQRHGADPNQVPVGVGQQCT